MPKIIIRSFRHIEYYYTLVTFSVHIHTHSGGTGYLQHRWLDPGVGEQVPEALAVPVADPNVLDQTFVHKRLHGSPGVLDRHLLELHPLDIAVRVVEPLGRVAGLERDKLEADREVDEEEVEVVEAEVLQRPPARGLHVLGCVEGVPQLGGDEDLLPGHHPGTDGVSYPLTNLRQRRLCSYLLASVTVLFRC